MSQTNTFSLSTPLSLSLNTAQFQTSSAFTPQELFDTPKAPILIETPIKPSILPNPVANDVVKLIEMPISISPTSTVIGAKNNSEPVKRMKEEKTEVVVKKMRIEGQPATPIDMEAEKIEKKENNIGNC